MMWKSGFYIYCTKYMEWNKFNVTLSIARRCDVGCWKCERRNGSNANDAILGKRNETLQIIWVSLKPFHGSDADIALHFLHTTCGADQHGQGSESELMARRKQLQVKTLYFEIFSNFPFVSTSFTRHTNGIVSLLTVQYWRHSSCGRLVLQNTLRIERKIAYEWN